MKNLIKLTRGCRIGLILVAIWHTGLSLSWSQTTNSSCTVDVSKPGAVVAPICRGQQIEEFNYQFQGGLYAQLINNPSFEELKNPNS